jgi:hypothetical protein
MYAFPICLLHVNGFIFTIDGLLSLFVSIDEITEMSFCSLIDDSYVTQVFLFLIDGTN